MIWYDACTGKHVRYGNAIAKRLLSLNYKVVLTTRRHPDTLRLTNLLKADFKPVGTYNPDSLRTRLEQSLRRQLLFSKKFQDKPPRFAISHGSVDQIRFAFGLKMPIITTFDTPHAEEVHKLTLPLAKYIVASKAIPKEIIQKYGTEGKIISFNGVDEVAWIRDSTPLVKYRYGKPLIVVRQLEEKAVYTRKKVDMLAIAKKLTKFGRVVFLSRYERKPIKGLIVPKRFIDSSSLVAQADLFVGVGGTITREAALRGTPAIIVKVFPKQYVDDFLAEQGFPIFTTKFSDAAELAKELIGKKYDVKKQLKKLDNPVELIINIVKKF